MRKILTVVIALILVFKTIVSVGASSEEVEVDLVQTPDYYVSERLKEEEEKYRNAQSYLDQKIVPFAGGSKMLNVTPRKQENSYFCGPAAAQMVIEFVSNKLISQSKLASNMGTVQGTGTYVYRLANELKAQTGINYGYSHIDSRKFSTPYLSNIDSNLPVVFHVMTKVLNLDYSFNGGHYVVGIGYYWFAQGNTGASNLTYIDPWYGNGIFGERTISFSEMEKAIRANAGYYIW